MISPNPAGESSRDTSRPPLGPARRDTIPSRQSGAGDGRPRRGAPAPASPPADAIRPSDLFNALRRRWKVALGAGLPLAAVAAVAAWILIPATFTAYALVRISSSPEVLVFDTAERVPEFQTYRQTQSALIKSRFALNAALRRPGVVETETLRAQRHPLNWLEEELEVETWQSPEILKISLTGRRPEELALIVNAVKEAYLDEVVNAERKQRLAKLKVLEDTYDQTHRKVLAKQARVDALAKQLGTGDARALTVKQQMALEYFAQLRREHARVRFELMREQVREASGAGAEEPSGASEAPEAVADAQSAVLGGDPEGQLMAERVTQVKSLIARYERQVKDPHHPALEGYRQELASLEKELAAREAKGPNGERLSRLETLKRQEELLREEAESYSDLVKSIGTSSFELEAMRDELTQVRAISDRVGGEMEALRIELAAPQRVVLLQDAEIPVEPDAARRQKLTALAGLGIFGLVLAAVALVELRNRRATNPEEVAAALKLNLMGTLPARPRSVWNPASPQLASRRRLWNDAMIESVDAIRTLLLREAPGGSAYAVMIASAAAGEGKTTLASQLAGSLARAGRRTVLVDWDLRRPVVHRLFGFAQQPGLSESLRGEAAVADCVRTTSQDGLSVLPAGRVDEGTLQALGRDGGRTVIDELRSRFEFVVIDTSPLMFVADSGVVAQSVDGAVLAVRRDVSRLPMVSAACDRLDLLGVPVLGAVMLGVPSESPRYGYGAQHHTVTLNSL